MNKMTSLLKCELTTCLYQGLKHWSHAGNKHAQVIEQFSKIINLRHNCTSTNNYRNLLKKSASFWLV